MEYSKGLHATNIIFFCLMVLVQVMFCFYLKNLGLSMFELCVFFMGEIVIDFLLGSIYIGVPQANSTLVMGIVVFVQIVLIHLLIMAVLTPWIKEVFLL